MLLPVLLITWANSKFKGYILLDDMYICWLFTCVYEDLNPKDKRTI